MSLDDDSRYERFLTDLHMLSQANYTGTLGLFRMSNGRISQSTMKILNDLRERVVPSRKQEGCKCQT